MSKAGSTPVSLTDAIEDLASKSTQSISADQASQSTRFYSSQDTQATSLFVTQINNMLKKSNRRKNLSRFK